MQDDPLLALGGAGGPGDGQYQLVEDHVQAGQDFMTKYFFDPPVDIKPLRYIRQSCDLVLHRRGAKALFFSIGVIALLLSITICCMTIGSYRVCALKDSTIHEWDPNGVSGNCLYISQNCQIGNEMPMVDDESYARHSFVIILNAFTALCYLAIAVFHENLHQVRECTITMWFVGGAVFGNFVAHFRMDTSHQAIRRLIMGIMIAIYVALLLILLFLRRPLQWTFGIRKFYRIAFDTTAAKHYSKYQRLISVNYMDLQYAALFYLTYYLFDALPALQCVIVGLMASCDVIATINLKRFVKREAKLGTSICIGTKAVTGMYYLGMFIMYQICVDSYNQRLASFQKLLVGENGDGMACPSLKSIASVLYSASFTCNPKVVPPSYDFGSAVVYYLLAACACRLVLLGFSIEMMYAFGTGHIRDLFFVKEIAADDKLVVQSAAEDWHDLKPLERNTSKGSSKTALASLSEEQLLRFRPKDD